MIMKKRGQGLTTGTLVLIVLGIIVLTFLIYGFTVGFGNFFDKIANFGGGGKGNLATLASACNIACETGDKFAFESQKRVVKLTDGTEIKDVTCADLREKDDGRCLVNGVNSNLKGVREDNCIIKVTDKANLLDFSVEFGEVKEDNVKINGKCTIGSVDSGIVILKEGKDVVEADCQSLKAEWQNGWGDAVVTCSL